MTPPRGSSPKRERQYEHIKEGIEQRGESEAKAKEIAARTVNKERARAGESKTASKLSLEDMSSSRRGGLHSHSGPQGPRAPRTASSTRRPSAATSTAART